eukprot:TRINITY_DN3838_c0_g1_i2.p1 TRINITY_DN3838_c0_g1~~TRINITY_DN3838_c0_g1_i2.p1  ORF type:complete len:341 (+),score=75.42 TRINITY_DN3838_c0_g1_i2:103-1125(+)
MTSPLAEDTVVGNAFPKGYKQREDCVDFFGTYNQTEGGDLAEDSNNPECYRNMVWAQRFAKTHPENYPPGSTTLVDFQCALYLKGDIEGVNQPGPFWNCTHAPCAALTAPIEKEFGTEDSKGTRYCVRKADAEPSTPPCTVTDGSAVSAAYPCLCHGSTSHVCNSDAPLCFESPIFCAAQVPEIPPKEPEEAMPLWAWLLIDLGIAAIIGAGVLGAMKMMKKPAAKSAPKKRAPAPPQKSAPPAPKAEPAPAPEVPVAAPVVYTAVAAPPVQTVTTPLISYQPTTASITVPQSVAPVQYAVAQPVQYSTPVQASNVQYSSPVAVAGASPVAFQSTGIYGS